MTSNVKSMAHQVEVFKLKPFANMLDAGGATATAYHLPPNAKFHLVVIDGAGNIAYNASSGWRYDSGPNAGKFVHLVQEENSLKKVPHLLNIKTIPKSIE